MLFVITYSDDEDDDDSDDDEDADSSNDDDADSDVNQLEDDSKPDSGVASANEGN